MVQPLTSTSFEALIEGAGSGQITVGNYSVLVHPDHGAVVSFIPPGSQPAPRPLIDEKDLPFEDLSEGKAFDEATARQTLAPLPDEEKRVLSALAAVGGGPVGASHLAILADVADPRPAFDALLARDLVQPQGLRYSLAGDLDSLLPSIWDLSPWCERALAYFLPWAEARREDTAAVLEESDALRHLLDWAAGSGRHAEAQRLGRALDTALILSGRWSAWARVLQRVHAAAVALQDRTTEAWALHQLGTRLLCLDDKAAARPLLNQSLAIRESLGDGAGAAVTRHNLGLLGALPAVRLSWPFPVSLRPLPWLALALLILLLGGIRLWSSRIAEPNHDTATVYPISSDQESPPKKSQDRIASVKETSDPASDAAVTTPPMTTDQPMNDTAVESPPEPTAEASGTVKEPEPLLLQGWCCAGGDVSQSSKAECTDRHGRFFFRQRVAETACLMSGCCIEGSFKLGEKQDRCDELGGTYMSAAEVPVRCRKPQEGWCCLPGGTLVQISPEACRRGEGTLFESKAEAQRECTAQ